MTTATKPAKRTHNGVKVVTNPAKSPIYNKAYLVTPKGEEAAKYKLKPLVIDGCCDEGEAARWYYVEFAIKQTARFRVEVERVHLDD